MWARRLIDRAFLRGCSQAILAILLATAIAATFVGRALPWVSDFTSPQWQFLVSAVA
jgi:hypothetical protein